MLQIMKSFFILTFSLFYSLYSFASSPSWGKTGHRAVGAMAAEYLNSATKKKLEKLLDGESLALASNHSDEIKSDEKYNEYFPWHYVNFHQDKKYGEDPINEKGDLVQGIKKCILKIRDEKSSKAEKKFFIKMLVHLVGDLHQPLHVGNGEDKGGNDIKLKWFYEDSNLHRVWDSEMIDYYKMSYSELSENREVLTKDKIAEIEKGTLLDWTYESKTLATKVYASAEAAENLKYKYMYYNFPLVRSQLQKGGIRLAFILEQILKKKSSWVNLFLQDIK